MSLTLGNGDITLPSGSVLYTTGNAAGGSSCRSYAYCNGSGTVYGGFNYSSVSKPATGFFQLNFSTAMPSANYSVTASRCVGNSGLYYMGLCFSDYTSTLYTKSTSAVQFRVDARNGGAYDFPWLSIMVFY